MASTQSNIICLQVETPPVDPSVALKGVLNRLRFLAAGCRASARLDLFLACESFSPDPRSAAQSSAMAVMRTLDQALGRRAVILTPGSHELSFDETWLLRVIERAMVGDKDSLNFLIGRHVASYKRAVFAHLISTLAEQIEALQRT